MGLAPGGLMEQQIDRDPHGLSAWEQVVLPLRVRGDLLWSPVHSGPIMLESQVVTVHDVVPLDHPEWLDARFARWYRFMLPRLVRRARHVIAISGFTRDRLIATTGLAGDRISVVHNGIGSAFTPASEEDIECMRADLGLGDAPYLLSLGSHEPRKNLECLVEAWKRALPGLPDDLVLVIAGETGRASVFGKMRAIQRNDRVIPLGRVDDERLPALYSGADWFVYLSRYEGFGLPPLEAMACGTPALVSDIPVFRETMGEAAMTVDGRDPAAVATILRRITSDAELRSELSTRARECAGRFDWRTTARQTRDILTRFG